MGLDSADLLDDGDGGGKASSVSCSICLDVVADNGDRAWAKLHCGHQFHLDCIGSAFNVKGTMQCPNCRKIEKGQWLYANGSRSFPDFSADDYWTHDEDLYDLSFTEMSFGVHWCPFSGLAQIHSGFDDGELSTTSYHELIGQHPIFTEHAPALSSTPHPCPYFAYIGPVHSSSSSNPNASVSDANFGNQWSGQSNSSEMPPNSYAFPASMDPHYSGWDQHHSSSFPASSRVDQPSVSSASQRASRANSDMPRIGSYVHTFPVGQSSASRSPIPPYQGSAARARDRAQALQAYFHPTNSPPPVRTTSGLRRSNTTRVGLSQIGQGGPSLDQNHVAGGGSGFYFIPSSARNFPEASENPGFRQSWEREAHMLSSSFPLAQPDRDQVWRPVHQAGPGGGGPAQFRMRHGGERMPPQDHHHWS